MWLPSPPPECSRSKSQNLLGTAGLPPKMPHTLDVLGDVYLTRETICCSQVGNVGDSRVVCGRDGKAIPMTTDHKPTLPEERARIVACGGDVVNARVDGNLAVSRAFGDSQYKGISF